MLATNWTGIVAGCARSGGSSSSTGSGTRPLVFTAPSATRARADLALWVSDDNGRSWNNGKPRALLVPGPAAYSDVVAMNATHWALLVENGKGEFAQRISFALFNI